MSILLRRWFIQLFKVCDISVTLLTIGRHHFQLGMTKKPFVHPLRDSLTPADLRLRPLLGAFRTSGAVPSGLFSHPLFHNLITGSEPPSEGRYEFDAGAQVADYR